MYKKGAKLLTLYLLVCIVMAASVLLIAYIGDKWPEWAASYNNFFGGNLLSFKEVTKRVWLVFPCILIIWVVGSMIFPEENKNG